MSRQPISIYLFVTMHFVHFLVVNLLSIAQEIYSLQPNIPIPDLPRH